MISRLIDTLHAAGLELDAREVAEVLWLAPFLDGSPAPAGPVDDRGTSSQPTGSPPPAEVRPSAEGAGAPPTPAMEPEPSPPGVEVVMPERKRARGAPVRRGGGRAFRSPGALALPNALQLGRALRPLRRRIGSARHQELDEGATADRIAREGLWLPVLRPGRSRWLELELVLDTGRSMALWGQTLAELRSLLRYLGGFRDVRTWSLVTEGEGRVRLYRGGAEAAHGARERSPRELMGTPAERRLILVVSDCVSPAWHRRTGGVGELLREWGRGGPVAILQLLPQRVWVRTALRHLPAVWLHGRAPGESNARLVLGAWPGALTPRPRGTVPVPVVTLERESLASWARVVAGGAGAWSPGVLLREGGPARKGVERGREEVEPLERVRRFDATASPLAQRLVRLFAAVPLSLPVMRLVWHTRLPEAAQVQLAEVFLSGLLQEVGDGAGEPEQAHYDFVPGVRELLLESLSPAESLDILEGVSRYLEERHGRTLDFQAMLADPTAFGGEALDESLRPFARVAAAVLRQWGGEYAALATRLEGLPPGAVEQQARAREARPQEEPSPREASAGASSEAPRWQPSGKRVLVVGSSEAELSEGLRRLCAVLGRELARKGHSLLAGSGKPGVDQEVGVAYVAALQELGISPEAHYLQVAEEWGSAGYLAHADVMVLLRGAVGSFQVFKAAHASFKPVLALPGTEGFARTAYQTALSDDVYRWRSGLWSRRLRGLDVPVSSPEQVERAVDVLSRLIDRLHPGAELAAYSRAMLDLLHAVVPSLLARTEGEGYGYVSERLGWRAFMNQLARAAGLGRLKPVAEAGVSVEPGARERALTALRATLPGTAERLLEDFERCLSVEEPHQLGLRVQEALVPLVLEFGGREALDVVGEVISRMGYWDVSPALNSLVEATRKCFDSQEAHEEWLRVLIQVSPQELEFKRRFLEVAERLGEQYHALKDQGFDAVESALLASVRQSYHKSEGVLPLARFVQDFVASGAGLERAVAYLLIQEYRLDELILELGRSVAPEYTAIRYRSPDWELSAFCFCACLLHRQDESARQALWPYVRTELARWLRELRHSSRSGGKLALAQAVERLSAWVEGDAAPELEEPPAPRKEAAAQGEPRAGPPSDAVPWRWSGRWIAVVGTRSEELPERLAQVCRALGQKLAIDGHGLVGGGWPGVDALVGAAYVAALRELRVEVGEHFRQIVEQQRLPRVAAGTIRVARQGSSFSEAVRWADAVVLLGDVDDWPEMFETVRSLGRPLLPLPATGAGAEAVFHHIRRDEGYRLRVGLPLNLQELDLDVPISSSLGIHVGVDRVLDLAGQVPMASEVYARALLRLLRRHWKGQPEPRQVAQRKWSDFCEQLVLQADEARFHERQRLRREMLQDVSGALSNPSARETDVDRESLEAALPRMGKQLLADFEQLTGFVAQGFVDAQVLEALIPWVVRFGGKSMLESIRRLSEAEAEHPRFQDTLPEALATAQSALELREREAWLDPEDVGKQREAARGHDRVGELMSAQGNLPGALAAYRCALDIWERLVRDSPEDPERLHALARSRETVDALLRALNQES